MFFVGIFLFIPILNVVKFDKAGACTILTSIKKKCLGILNTHIYMIKISGPNP